MLKCDLFLAFTANCSDMCVSRLFGGLTVMRLIQCLRSITEQVFPFAALPQSQLFGPIAHFATR